MLTVGPVDPALTRELRRTVLRPEASRAQPLPGDELGPAAVHLGAVEDGRALCTCFVYRDPCPWLIEPHAWHLRQMATWPERRGQGLGARVVAAAVEVVRERGAALLWCNARERAVPFYRRLGFQPHGEIFTDERHSIPHLRMHRDLREPFPDATSST
jgi:GNAT superfamily N-acetyltransferase